MEEGGDASKLHDVDAVVGAAVDAVREVAGGRQEESAHPMRLPGAHISKSSNRTHFHGTSVCRKMAERIRRFFFSLDAIKGARQVHGCDRIDQARVG